MANVGSVNVDITANIRQLTSSLNAMQSQLNQATRNAQQQASQISSSMSNMGRNVSNAIKGYLIYKGIDLLTNGISETVKAFNKMESSMMGLGSIVESQGRSMSNATKFIQSYVADGLVPMADAVTSYKQLSQRGYSTDQIEKIMTAFKDSASFGRQASLTMGEAIRGATEGLKNENSILVDNAGVTKNVSMMWADYARQIGKGEKSLTLAEKRQAEVNGIMQETAFQVGDAAKYTTTLGGKLAGLSAQFFNLKASIGSVIAPILSALIPSIQSAMIYITSFFTLLGGISKKIFGYNTEQAKTSGVSKKAETAQSKLGNAVKKTGKAVASNLQSFDQLNTLTKETADNTEDVSSGVGGDVGVIDMTESIKTPEIDTSFLDKYIEKINNIKVLFSDSITGAMSNLQTASDSLYNAFKKLKDIISGIIFKNADAIKQSLDSLSQGTVDVINMFIELAGKLPRDAFDLYNRYIQENAETMTAVYEFTILYIISLLDNLGAIFSTTAKGIMKVYDDNIAPLKQLFMDVFNPISDLIGSLVNNVLTPLFMPAIKAMGDVVREVMPLIWNNISTVINDIVALLTLFWKTYFEPLIVWISEKVLPLLQPVFTELGLIFKDLLDSAIYIIKDMTDIFSGLTTFLLGAFTNDWGKAWEGIKKIFEGVFNSLVNIARIPINSTIRLINLFLDALSQIKINIPSMNIPFIGKVGGQSLSFPKLSISEIPALAQGGIVTSPTQALIGEGAYDEAVIPLGGSKFDMLINGIGNAVTQALQTTNQNNKSNSNSINLIIDGKEIAKILAPLLSKENNRVGSSSIFVT